MITRAHIAQAMQLDDQFATTGDVQVTDDLTRFMRNMPEVMREIRDIKLVIASQARPRTASGVIESGLVVGAFIRHRDGTLGTLIEIDGDTIMVEICTTEFLPSGKSDLWHKTDCTVVPVQAPKVVTLDLKHAVGQQ